MNCSDHVGAIDVIPPKEPVTISVELSPEEVELAFATEGDAVRTKVLTALVIAMLEAPIHVG